MTKIILKIFKSNIWNCILCFVSVIVVSTVLFLFEGIRIMLLSTMSEQERMDSSIGIAAQTYIFGLLFIGIILILYTVSNYSRTRIRDYGMFLILGSDKLDIIRMIFTEYGLICIISYLFSCIIGTPFLFLIKVLLLSEGILVKVDYHTLIKIVPTTLLYMFMIFTIAIILNLVNLQKHSLSQLLNYKEKKSKLPSIKISIPGAVLGILGIVITSLILGNGPITYKKMKYGILLALCSLYLCFTYVGGLLLYLLKIRKNWYEKHLLKIKNLYYRFSENKNIILIVFIINFFVLVFININIVEYGNTSSQYTWKYPYDYVWLTEDEKVKKIEQAVEGYNTRTTKIAYTSLTSNQYDSYIGIPISSYQKLTGKEESLNNGELIAVLQKAEDDSEIMFQRNQVYLKKGNKKLKFQIKREVKEILLVAQQADVIRILVLSDEDYNSMENAQNDNQLIVAQKVKKQTEKLEDSLKETAKSLDALFYSKDSLMQQDRQEDIATLLFYICMGIFLIISNMTILAIKVWSEVPLLVTKYEFLEKLGMDEKEVKNNVKGELTLYLKIPFLLSVITGIIMLEYIVKSAGVDLVIPIIALFFALIMLQGFYIIGIRIYGYRLIVNKMKHCDRGVRWN